MANKPKNKKKGSGEPVVTKGKGGKKKGGKKKK